MAQSSAVRCRTAETKTSVLQRNQLILIKSHFCTLWNCVNKSNMDFQSPTYFRGHNQHLSTNAYIEIHFWSETQTLVGKGFNIFSNPSSHPATNCKIVFIALLKNCNKRNSSLSLQMNYKGVIWNEKIQLICRGFGRGRREGNNILFCNCFNFFYNIFSWMEWKESKRVCMICHHKKTTLQEVAIGPCHSLIENFNFVSNTNLWHFKTPVNIKKEWINKVMDEFTNGCWKSLLFHS